MSDGNRRNVAHRLPKRPGSARRATDDDPVQRNDPPATSSSEADISTLITAIKAIKTVDLSVLRILFNSTVQHDLKYGQNGQDGSTGRDGKVDWETKYMELKGEYDKLATQIKEKQELENKLKHFPAHFKTTEQTSLEQNNEIVRLQQRVESGDKKLTDLNQKLQTCLNELELKEKRLKIQQQAMEEVQKAKDDALTRLSRQMGRQMSEGNPNITDLSDQNRPSKLGEMYSELYDNEWTDAFEVLAKTFHLDNKSSIKLLLKILWESSKHARDVSQSAMKRIENLLSGSSEGVTPDCKRLLREARKHVNIKKADSLFQDFREKLTTFVDWKYVKEENIEVYIKRCFQLCWLMSIQDPPVVLSREPERGAQFDTNLYKHYMHSGDTIDYVIWPALLLHTDGPLLAKGVAEPYAVPEAKGFPATVNDDISLDRRSQMEPDGNVRESTSGSGRMDTTQYVNDASFLSKSHYSPIVTQTYPVDESKYRVHSETPSIRGQKSVSKSNMAFDKRSQIEHDIKAREPASRSGRIETMQFGNDATSSSKSRYSSIVTQTYPVDESKYKGYSETTSIRGRSPVSENNMAFDKRSQIEHDREARESTSRSGRIEATQYGNHASSSSKSRYSPIVTQKYPVDEKTYRVHSATPTRPGQSRVSEQMQLHQHDVFKDKYDRESFQRFCQGLMNFNVSTLRQIYGRDYDRYYLIYSNAKFDNW
ncbi:hypothetical protein ACJMK2_031001 [Sinanodonta woodiana]|uniref:Mitochondria-eating protein n=1 Tax=Sinanodonta woodiana TaxID=1069815 RepID=A0ABD3WYT9_SINWO